MVFSFSLPNQPLISAPAPLLKKQFAEEMNSPILANRCIAMKLQFMRLVAPSAANYLPLI
jgi:hypothetical protein